MYILSLDASVWVESSPCAVYPCGTHGCVEVSGGFECIRPNGDILCTFEPDDSSCNVLVDLYSMQNDILDPVINTGKRTSTAELSIL